MKLTRIHINGVTYDVSRFAESHPGGKDAILSFDGKDATTMFYALHHPYSYAHKVLETLPKVDTANNNSGNNSYMTLYSQVLEQVNSKNGFLMKTKYFIKEYVILILLLSFGVFLLPKFFFVSSLTWAFALHHAGWMGHHLIHMQAYSKYKWLNDLQIYLVTCIIAGYDPIWWKNKHNIKHHSHTNVIDKDEDIDQEHFRFHSKISTKSNLVKYQHITLWLSVPFLKTIWHISGVQYALNNKNYKSLWCLSMHYAVLFSTMRFWAQMTILSSIMWYFLTLYISGIFLGIVVIQSHNGEEVFYEQSPDHFIHTLKTTRNLHPSPFMNFFTGYLNYQIEHHLFPWLPSCFFESISGKIKTMCKENELQYKCMSMYESCRYLHSHMKDIAKKSKQP